MAIRHFVTRFFVVFMVCLVSLPVGIVRADKPTASTDSAEAMKTVDVALDSQGRLQGQVLDAAGEGQAAAFVHLYGADGKPVTSNSNDEGRFAYAGTRPGVYFLQAGNTTQVCRIWEAAAAPPSAVPSVFIVGDADATRAQMQPTLLNRVVQKTKRALTNPLVVAGVIATAVAIPVAIHNDDDSSS